MDIVIFSLIGIAVYFMADHLLVFIETKRGKPFENRSIIYFIIFLSLIVISFELVQYLMAMNVPSAS